MTAHRSRVAALALTLACWTGAMAVRAAEPTPSAPVGMVAQPCPAGSFGRTDADLALAAGFFKEGPPDPGVLAAWAKEAPERTRLEDWRKANDWADLCRYRLDNERIARAGKVRVVFLGDSITEFWKAADPAFFADGVVNRGISGQTSGQLLLRFQQDVVSLRPRAVHILVGTNDVAGNNGPERPEDLKNNLRAMLAIAQANHLRVILGSIPPAATFSWRPALRPAAQIREINVWIAAFAKAQGAAYIDYGAVLADPDGAMKPGLSRDGVHPLKAGYALMKPLSEKAMPGPTGRPAR
ncbi:GDSL-type esterase/lipase family protein [Phenylobacterium sp.]|uniref:GDSL-type esterase/lipase family protein n=1 Tax=Phenylobacterium sp. TaxID=1871053 RepID=UPI00374D4841